MPLVTSPRFLRHVMLLDAVSCFVTGALQLAFTTTLVSLLGLPALLLQATGCFLLAYAGVAAIVALQDPVPRGWVALFAAGNGGWALACVSLLAGGALQPTALGVAWVMAQVLVVLALGGLQWIGIRAPHRHLVC